MPSTSNQSRIRDFRTTIELKTFPISKWPVSTCPIVVSPSSRRTEIVPSLWLADHGPDLKMNSQRRHGHRGAGTSIYEFDHVYHCHSRLEISWSWWREVLLTMMRCSNQSGSPISFSEKRKIILTLATSFKRCASHQTNDSTFLSVRSPSYLSNPQLTERCESRTTPITTNLAGVSWVLQNPLAFHRLFFRDDLWSTRNVGGNYCITRSHPSIRLLCWWTCGTRG